MFKKQYFYTIKLQKKKKQNTKTENKLFSSFIYNIKRRKYILKKHLYLFKQQQKKIVEVLNKKKFKQKTE